MFPGYGETLVLQGRDEVMSVIAAVETCHWEELGSDIRRWYGASGCNVVLKRSDAEFVLDALQTMAQLNSVGGEKAESVPTAPRLNRINLHTSDMIHKVLHGYDEPDGDNPYGDRIRRILADTAERKPIEPPKPSKLRWLRGSSV